MLTKFETKSARVKGKISLVALELSFAYQLQNVLNFKRQGCKYCFSFIYE